MGLPKHNNHDKPKDDRPSQDHDKDKKANSFVMAHGGLPDGRFVGPYQVRSLLGSGAFGVVYLAQDTRNDQNVALKLPRLEVLMDDDKRQRFEVEASIGARLVHPGIVQVLESGTAGSLPYIATDWCDGSDLGQWLANCELGQQAMPTWREAAELIASVAEAIHYAHQQGVAHRDLKPANILLEFKKSDDVNATTDGLSQFRARVTDFGLAKLSEASITDTRSSLMIGTPVYMAPERVAGQTETKEQAHTNQAGIVADVYSLGAILMEMLTGKPPLSGSNYLELVGEAVSLSNSSPGQAPKGVPQKLPNGLSGIISTCLRSHPKFRYQSAADLAADLRRSLNGEPILGRPVTLEASLRHWIGNRKWYAIAGWFAVGSQILFTVWMMLSDVFKIRFGLLSPEQYFDILPELLLIAGTTSLTTIVVGLFCIRRHRWAVWMGTAFAAMNLVPPLIAMFHKPSFFGEIYETSQPYFSFQIHLVISLIFISQLALYLLAIAGPYVQVKRS